MTPTIRAAALDRAAEPTAADLMSAPVVAVSVRDSLGTAWSVLYRSGLRHLVVVDSMRCVGVLDDRRIVMEWPLGLMQSTPLTVGDVIRRQFAWVEPTTPLPDIAQTMLDAQVDALPVLNARGEVLGLVTVSDLLTSLAVGTKVRTEEDLEP